MIDFKSWVVKFLRVGYPLSKEKMYAVSVTDSWIDKLSDLCRQAYENGLKDGRNSVEIDEEKLSKMIYENSNCSKLAHFTCIRIAKEISENKDKILKVKE